MKKEIIKIVYIDDVVDVTLDKYLNEKYNNENYSYESIIFNPNQEYKKLLANEQVLDANIIFIDFLLFEGRNERKESFDGEEIKIVLKKLHPFIKVFVITQNEDNDNIFPVIQKYDPSKFKAGAEEYYDEALTEKIEKSVSIIKLYRKLADRFQEGNWDPCLIGKISDDLEGDSEYDELSAQDIRNVINLFKDIQEKLDVQ